jgi:hypothetical protein
MIRDVDVKRAEDDVSARIGVTVAALLFALIAFLGGGPTPGGFLDPFGILFLSLAVLTWLAWDKILGGYSSSSGGDGAELPLLARFGPVFIKGITSMKHTNLPRPPNSTSAGPSHPVP